MKKIALFILVTSILISSFGLSVNAAVIKNEDEGIETCRVIVHPVTLDQYTDAVFSTIDQARNRFGWDFTYTQTNHYYLGVYYNWYYSFADGTKQFFRVLFDDDNDSLTSIIPDKGNVNEN